MVSSGTGLGDFYVDVGWQTKPNQTKLSQALCYFIK